MGSTPTFSVTVTAQADKTNFGPNIAQRLTPSIARFSALAEQIFTRLRVAVPAVVISFDPAAQTVSLQIAIKEYAQQNTAAAGAPVNIQSVAQSLPVLSDVPVVILGAGGWSATFPIQAGDECLALFADTAIDTWFQSGGTDNVQITGRRHSLSDAIALFGVRSQPNVLENYSTGSMQLRSDDGTVIIDLKKDQITVTAPNVTINCPGGSVIVNAKEATVNASDTATVQGQTVNVQGNQVTIGDSTTIDSRVFLQHVHTGVSSGGGTSGPVA